MSSIEWSAGDPKIEGLKEKLDQIYVKIPSDLQFLYIFVQIDQKFKESFVIFKEKKKFYCENTLIFTLEHPVEWVPWEITQSASWLLKYSEKFETFVDNYYGKS